MNYACVDDSRFDPDRPNGFARQDLGFAPDRIVLAVVARLHPSKGQLEFLRAAERLARSGAPLTVLLLGGPLGSPFAERLREIGQLSQGLVKMVGLVDDPESYYPIVDVAVNSRIDAEPFGMSVIEAMLMRRPVLAHSLGGPAETVVDGVTGWHVTDPTIEGFGIALERVLADRARWDEMGAAGRDRALKHFSTDVIVERYLEVIQRAERDAAG